MNASPTAADAARPAPVRVKICGLTRAADVDAAVAAGANAIGFVRYEKSGRCVTPAQAVALARRLPPLVQPVLLFVNAPADEVTALAAQVPGAILQFHGDESPAQCRAIAAATGCRYWRAARIPLDHPERFDLLEFMRQHAGAQGILLDARIAGYGGGGQSFDWQALPARLPAHLILSGGLDAANVADGIAALRGRGQSLTVDVSSGVEATDASGQPLHGIKDAARIRQFMAAVRATDADLQA